MTKLISLIVAVLTVVQIARPLGLPGFRRRGDAWKLAFIGLVLFVLVAMTKGG
jgi:hypothetical protein